ncbi:hypothetical protein [Chitinophaga arvensicola]|uniref:Uncharacterized protein n=1 Tax=Chitinophaga arvensicola TaxID=29529 RepID=A0A1I0PMA1_9BACT|nr:hypothetical protein [Chitinophaga arvensicola]SEW15554.1 hypothetical protein SAMN04488122_0868 [Chitinophaga arvensicola]
MKPPPLLHLCQPVDPFAPVIFNIKFARHITYELRTVDVARDLAEVLGWMGKGSISEHQDADLAADTFYQSYMIVAKDDNSQALVVTLDGVPAIQIDVRTGPKTLAEIIGGKQCYVLSLKANQQLRLKTIQHGIMFAFSSMFEVTQHPILCVQVDQDQTYWHVVCTQLKGDVIQRITTSTQAQTIYRFDRSQFL